VEVEVEEEEEAAVPVTIVEKLGIFPEIVHPEVGVVEGEEVVVAVVVHVTHVAKVDTLPEIVQAKQELEMMEMLKWILTLRQKARFTQATCHGILTLKV
jgi:hypothetical protein